MSQEQEIVVASVILKPRGDFNVLEEISRLSVERLNEFLPKEGYVERAASLLRSYGFKIESQIRTVICFSGSRELFESIFHVDILQRRVRIGGMDKLDGGPREISLYESKNPLILPDELKQVAEAILLAKPALTTHSPHPPVPNPHDYVLDVLKDVPARLNVASVHAMGITGDGIRISMVDTGFINRVAETQASTDAAKVSVDHPIRAVEGVWLSTDPAHTGTNYWTGGSFAGSTITLGHALPASNTTVEVVYSCLHPHYTTQGYNIDDIRAVPEPPAIPLEVNADEEGHGTAQAANIFAVAPNAIVSFVKANSLGVIYPAVGFVAAMQHQTPQIISCSWSVFLRDAALEMAIVDAVESGIVVVFSAGNKKTTDNELDLSSFGLSVTCPELLSVGGAYPIKQGGYRASDFASSFDSFVWTHPQRHIPDVVGLVGEQANNASLIMLPTQPGSYWDNFYSPGDNTAPDDGWCVMSGTSAAAPQAAGMAALLLQHYHKLGLTPMAVKNILENSARDVTTGTSGRNDQAGPGWDAATGFGLINGQAAIDYLRQGVFNPYIRDSIEDNGTEPVVTNRLWASPDIIVRTEAVADPQTELGQTVKHRDDLCDRVEDGQNNYVYLRVQNRGTEKGDAKGLVYFTAPGMLANPTAWTKIGQLPIFNLSPGELRVIGPLVWPDAQIPGPGHYCLISILDSPTDPAPNLANIHTANDFTTMVRDKNNVAWRNIEIVDIVPGAPMTYGLYVQGLPGEEHTVDLDLDLSRFAPGVKATIKTPRRSLDAAEVERMTVLSRSSTRVVLGHSGGIGRIRNLQVGPREKEKLTISYTVPHWASDGTYRSVARLLVDGETAGVYTHVATLSRSAFVGDRNEKEVHVRGCRRIAHISMYNRIPLMTLEEARARGLAKCATCLGG